MAWHPEIEHYVLAENYEPVVEFYEQAESLATEDINHYWHLGLAYLLLGQEEEAQATWLFAMAQGSDTDVEGWRYVLADILSVEAQRQGHLNHPQTALQIRHHARDICPESLENLLHLISLSNAEQELDPRVLEEWQVIPLLQAAFPKSIDQNLLINTLLKVIVIPSQLSLDFAVACLPHINHPDSLINFILPIANQTAHQERRVYYAVALAEFCLQLNPSHHQTLKKLSQYYLELDDYPQAIAAAQKFYNQSNLLSEKLLANGTLLSTLTRSGAWSEIPQVADHHRTLLQKVFLDPPQNFSLDMAREILIQSSLFFYQRDNLSENRALQRQISELFEKSLSSQISTPFTFSLTSKIKKRQRLKIGYIGHTFRAHSVGWLCRWLLYHHNRDLFEVGIYFVDQNQVSQNLDNPFFQTWFQPYIDFARSLGNDPWTIAQQIHADQIDILVDLDSTTLDLTCNVMALKPAPLQVTWIGFDASGLSTIDYFIADPYVLPEHAQQHYTEKIWRLPQTYLAVNGFEVDIPTLRREQLGIPEHAITYLSSQAGMKRHPDTVRWQMQIIKAVPESYFLIKGRSDQNTIQQFFTEIANEEGVDPQRLIFLPKDANEFIHRANLRIADIALDTYPYNGATTTLELLWMGIPVVTRVGEQFAARNSYTFMMNAGVTEGIAWSAEEYIEWGIRLGTDEVLRQQVVWKLRQSRHTSPLWNAKTFTQEMEKAYQKMWSDYVEQK